MPIDTSVKFFHSGMAGVGGAWAHALGQSGGVTATNLPIIKNVFVDGFNTKTASSLTVSSGVATMTFATAHGFDDYTVILVAGATPSALNGEKRITSVNSTTLSFDATGVSDITATGTITAKYAPLGWSSVGATPTTFPVIVRSTAPEGTGMGCAISMTNPNTAASTGISFEGYRIADSSSVSNSFGLRYAPGNPNIAGSFVYSQWIIVGDGRTVYILYAVPASGTAGGAVWTNNNGHIYGFGEFKSLASVDPYRSFVFGDTATIVSSSVLRAGLQQNHSSTAISSFLMIPGTVGGGTVGVTWSHMELNHGDGVAGAGTTSALTSYPNQADSALVLCRKIIGDGSGMRGYFRGLYQSPQPCASAFNTLDKVTGQGVLSGKTLLALRAGQVGVNTNGTGVTFFDITGPWE